MSAFLQSRRSYQAANQERDFTIHRHRPSSTISHAQAASIGEKGNRLLSLKDAVIRSVAAEPDQDRRMRLAAAMLTGQDTVLLEETYLHTMNLVHGKRASDDERTAAHIVIEMLALTLLSRVTAMDEHFEHLLDEIVELEFGPLDNPITYDTEDGFSIFLDPNEDDVPGDDDLVLDLWADAGTVTLSMRVNRDGGPRLTGSLDLDGVSDLRRGLALAVSDAEALQEPIEGAQDCDD
jgi:hypothetical protein